MAGAFSFGIFVSLIIASWHGLIDFIEHFILRFILFIRGYAPWNYSRFLDDATDRIFLRKVGGSYIFVHRLLLEYFASLTNNDSQNNQIYTARRDMK